jgi:hypothetical protein
MQRGEAPKQETGGERGLTSFASTQKECKSAQGFVTVTRGDLGLVTLNRDMSGRSDKAVVSGPSPLRPPP